MFYHDATSRRLRSWTTDRDWTHEETAERIGITVSQLKGLIYGGRDMGLDGVCHVCDVFGKTIDELACRGE